jgi:hypothetical protein
VWVVSGPATSTVPPLTGAPDAAPPTTRTSRPNATTARAPRADSTSDEPAVSGVQREIPKRCTYVPPSPAGRKPSRRNSPTT